MSESNGTTASEISLEVTYSETYTYSMTQFHFWYLLKKNENICDHKKTCVRTFIAALSNTNILKPPRCPLACEWINCIIPIQWDTT